MSRIPTDTCRPPSGSSCPPDKIWEMLSFLNVYKDASLWWVQKFTKRFKELGYALCVDEWRVLIVYTHHWRRLLNCRRLHRRYYPPRVSLSLSSHLTSRTWDFQVKVSEYTLQRSAQAILLTLSDNSQRQVWCHYKISFDMDAYGQELHTTDTTVDTSYLLHVCVVSVHIVSVNYIHTSFTFRTKMKTTSHLKLKKLIRWAWRKS